MLWLFATEVLVDWLLATLVEVLWLFATLVEVDWLLATDVLVDWLLATLVEVLWLFATEVLVDWLLATLVDVLWLFAILVDFAALSINEWLILLDSISAVHFDKLVDPEALSDLIVLDLLIDSLKLSLTS